jgi:uncharacterized protein (DUF433 family)
VRVDNYIEIPTGSGKRQEPIIKGKGVPIWSLVMYIRKGHYTPEQVSAFWDGYITAEEVRAAVLYQQQHPEMVEDRLGDDEE